VTTSCTEKNSQPQLLLTGRQALPRFRPLDQGSLGVSDRAPDLNVGRPVTSHPGFGEPGQAYLEKFGRFLWSEKDDYWHSRPLRRAAGGKRFRSHTVRSFD
jgi:hypothetical protein